MLLQIVPVCIALDVGSHLFGGREYGSAFRPRVILEATSVF